MPITRKRSIRVPDDVWEAAVDLSAGQEEPVVFRVMVGAKPGVTGIVVAALRAYVVTRRKASR